MIIEFESVSKKEIRIFNVADNKRIEIGRIFTPSSSGNNITNAIQICGFKEAFDLWGCSHYEVPKIKTHDQEYVYKNGKKEFEKAKDIQLLFDSETTVLQLIDHFRFSDICWGCFNKECSCERNYKYDNPFTVKREQDLFVEKIKEEDKEA